MESAINGNPNISSSNRIKSLLKNRLLNNIKAIRIEYPGFICSPALQKVKILTIVINNINNFINKRLGGINDMTKYDIGGVSGI